MPSISYSRLVRVVILFVLCLSAQAQRDTINAPGATPVSSTVTPSNLLYTIVFNTGNPTPQSVSILSSGAGTIGSWTATSSAPWISVSPASGAGEQTVTVSTLNNNLNPGTYTGTLTISAPASTPSSQAIHVTLVVLPTPSAQPGGGQNLYNGIVLPQQWPLLVAASQAFQMPTYLTSPPAVIPIDVGRQLFVDDFLIQATTMARTQHQPAMYSGNPIVVPNAADSAGVAMPYSDGVWYDPQDQTYKMWVRCGSGASVCYATSTDGMTWKRPSIAGAPANNPSQVQTVGSLRDSDVVWMDLQDPNPANKFKLFAYNPAPYPNMQVWFSPDGIAWTSQPQAPLIHSMSDRTTMWWNPFRSVWMASLPQRVSTIPETPIRPGANKGRLHLHAEGPNVAPDQSNGNPFDPTSSFWAGADDQDPPFIPGGANPQLDKLDAVAYESVMVGMFNWFYPDQGLVELGTGFSRDGFNWTRPNRGAGAANALIPASNQAGTWNGYNTQSVGGGFLVVGDELWFYFSGRNDKSDTNATGSTGLAKLRRDGFYSMNAGANPATLTTRQVQFTGKYLFVNVNNPQGSLQVQALLNGQVVATSSVVTGNSTTQPITWLNGLADLSSFAGQPIQFQFNLTNGELYSFWVSPNPSGASNGYVAAGGPGFTSNVDTLGSTRPPMLSVSPASLGYSATTGVNPEAKPLVIANVGGGNFSWTATSSQSWIKLSTTPGGPGAFTISGAAPQAIYVQVISTALAPSATAYTGTVTVNASGATPASYAANVSLLVSPQPVLAISPRSLSYAGTTAANPAGQAITISNTGLGTLNWTASSDQAWITFSTSPSGPGTPTLSGTGAQTIYALVATRSLGASLTYAGTVTISAQDSSPASQTVALSVAVAAAAPPVGTSHYVSPSGSASGDGTIGNPWDLQTALNRPASVAAGDTIWLRTGVYGNGSTVFTSNLYGTAAAPIIVRQYDGERATINGGMSILGAYSWFWGFEVTNLSLTTRTVSVAGSTNPFPNGFDVYAPGSKFVNLTVHDTAQGFGFWTAASDAEIYGCIIYNNGWIGPDRGHGHGIYTQNQTGVKLIRDNIILPGFGLGIQAYSSPAGYVQNYLLDGNTIANAGTLAGYHDYNLLFAGGHGLSNITVQNTFTYHTPADNEGLSALHWSLADASASSLTATGNYWIGGSTAIQLYNSTAPGFSNNTAYSRSNTTLETGSLLSPSASTWNNNKYYGSNQFVKDGAVLAFPAWQSESGLDTSSTFTATAPTGVWSFVRPNLYQLGRANITIYNWDQLNYVSVDVSQVLQPGKNFVVINAQDPFGTPVLSGTYAGGTIAIPMTGLTAAQPTGTSPTAAQPFGPQFGTFVLLQK